MLSKQCLNPYLITWYLQIGYAFVRYYSLIKMLKRIGHILKNRVPIRLFDHSLTLGALKRLLARVLSENYYFSSIAYFLSSQNSS